jgi:predicted ester cyclase
MVIFWLRGTCVSEAGNHAEGGDLMSEENKSLVRRYYDEVMGGLSGIEDLITDDFVDHHFPPDLPPGPAGVRKFFLEMIGPSFSDILIDIDFLLAEGDKVDCHFTLRATHSADFAGVTAKGNKINLPAISTFRIADGKLAEAWEIFDGAEFMRQLEA